jgi:hypothetical protein
MIDITNITISIIAIVHIASSWAIGASGGYAENERENIKHSRTK